MSLYIFQESDVLMATENYYVQIYHTLSNYLLSIDVVKFLLLGIFVNVLSILVSKTMLRVHSDSNHSNHLCST